MEQPEKRCLQISPYLFENQTEQKNTGCITLEHRKIVLQFS